MYSLSKLRLKVNTNFWGGQEAVNKRNKLKLTTGEIKELISLNGKAKKIFLKQFKDRRG